MTLITSLSILDLMRFKSFFSSKLLSNLKFNKFKGWLVLLLAFVFLAGTFKAGTVWAEQSGSSPDSGVTSHIKTIYDLLSSYSQGSDAGGSWGDWGSYWNRIRSTVIDYSQQQYQRWDDWRNGAGTDQNEYTGEESIWIETSSGGTAASVSGGDPEVTVTLESNTVYQDQTTGLYWSDSSTAGVDNEFLWTAGEDAATTTTACNFLADGDANDYCDNQDPGNDYVEDDDVSAAEFCLNLSLDSDNDGTPETDWHLPTQKELMQAYINGSANNLPNPIRYFWSASESSSNPGGAWRVSLHSGNIYGSTKNNDGTYVRCVRRN